MNDGTAASNHHRLVRVFGAAFAVALIFVLLAEIQARAVNLDLRTGDQDAYLAYVKKLKSTGYQYIGDRNRMPVYPWLMSLFYREGMTDRDYFELSKRLNTALTLAVMIGVFLIFRHYVSAFDAVTASLVIAFTVFLFKAPYFQAEVLAYGLNFLLFVLLLELVRSPRLKIAVAAGLTGGLAHLTKASVLPAIALGIFCLILYLVFQAAASWRQQKPTPPLFSKIVAPLFRPLLALMIFTGLFAATIYPYLRTSQAVFGHYFYNVNSTFYIWYNSWEEAKLGTRAHGDRVGWPDMPADQIPSLENYLQHHTLLQILQRFAVGGAVAGYFLLFRSDGYATFLLIYLAFLGPLLWQNRREIMAGWSNPRSLFTVFFVGGYLGGYFLLNAWWYYMVMAKTTNRYILALALPLLFVVVRLLSYAQSKDLSARILGRTVHSTVAGRFVFLVFGVYLVTVASSQIILMIEQIQIVGG